MQRFSQTFLDRVFTLQEQSRAQKDSRPATSLAKRFAAKEAFAKALGLGMRQGVKWSEIEVVNIATGQPTLKLYGRAAEVMEEKTPKGYRLETHISLTDTDSLAQAFVVIERHKNA